MKLWKKALCLTMALVLVFALCGCASFTPRVVTGVQKMARLESLHTDTTITADVTLTLLNQETPLTLTVRAAGDHQKDPALNALDLELELLDIDQHVLVYTSKEGDVLSVYSSWDNGEFWTRQTIEPEDDTAETGTALSPTDILKLALGLASYFHETGPVTLSGDDGEEIDGLGYEGVIPADVVQELLLSSGLTEKLGEDPAIQVNELLIPLVGEIPVKLALEKDSSMISRVELDLTQALGAALNELIAGAIGQSELLGAAVGLTVDSIRSITDLSRFDQVTVTMPAIPES